MAAWPYNTARWRKLRLLKLGRDPLCESCEVVGRGPVPANTVDHRKPISAGGEAFPHLDELASYCPSCHSIKTSRGSEAGAARSSLPVRPRRGCSADGTPLDPAHPWHPRKIAQS